MKDLRDLKDFDDTRCKTYQRRMKYVCQGADLAPRRAAACASARVAHLDRTPTCSRVRRVRGASARDGARNVKRFRGGLVFKAHRILYHSNLGSRIIKKGGTLRGAEHGGGGLPTLLRLA